MEENILTDETMGPAVTFSGYGKKFQKKILQALLTDHRWAGQMVDVMRNEYFDLTELRYLSDRYFKYYQRYKAFPSFETLITITRDDLKSDTDETLKVRIVEFLQEIRTNPDVGDLPYVKERALDFCRKQEIKESLERIVDKIEDSDYDNLVDELKRAVNRGACESVGHNFLVDRESRFIEAQRHPVATRMKELDANKILRGGLGRGELGVICAPTGVGKSHFLVQLGAAACLDGLNVNHYTFELSETAVGLRYDSHFTGIPSNEIPLMKNEVLNIEDNMKLGQLIIKSYPTGTANIQTLRAHIERTILQNHKPDLIIIDYADIMRSTRHFDALRFELKLIYEELRNLAMDLNLPIWTASQSNKDGATAEVVGLENMSEAYGKAMVADVVIGMSRKPTEKALGTGRMFIAKNRAGQDGIVYPIRINTATSTIHVVEGSDAMSMLEAQQGDERDVKETIRRKWAELKRDKIVAQQSTPTMWVPNKAPQPAEEIQ